MTRTIENQSGKERPKMNSAVKTEQIWRELHGKLESFLQQRVDDPHIVEDLLQETFVRIHRRIAEIDEIQRIPAWVFQIARNLVIDFYRSKAKNATSIADELESSPSEPENINELVIGWFPRMIASLPEGYREAVEMYELKGYSQQQVADELGISLSGAKSRIQRGRAKLKEKLFECCSFEKDRLGNLINFTKNNCMEIPESDCDC